MTKQETECPYCDTNFIVEFTNEDDELTFCPACGEELPSFQEEQLDMFHDGDWE